MARALITLPAQIRRGDVIEIRVLIAHPMETGYRRSNEGAMLKRNLIRTFSCAFEHAPAAALAKVVTQNKQAPNPFFSAKLHAAIAANPYLAFSYKVEASGTLIFTWAGDEGFSQTEQRSIKIS